MERRRSERVGEKVNVAAAVRRWPRSYERGYMTESLPRARIIRRRVVFDATRNKGRRVSNRFMALNFIARDAVKTGETGTVASGRAML